MGMNESFLLAHSAPALLKSVKKLAIDLERQLNDVLEEAIQDILKKYEKKASKK